MVRIDPSDKKPQHTQASDVGKIGKHQVRVLAKTTTNMSGNISQLSQGEPLGDRKIKEIGSGAKKITGVFQRSGRYKL